MPLNKSDTKAIEGLTKLKTSFLLLMVSTVGALVPIINIIAFFVGLYAIASLAFGLKALGDSQLNNAKDYKSAYVWIKNTVILYLSIIVLFVILFLATYANVSIIALVLFIPLFLLGFAAAIGVLVSTYKYILAIRRLADDTGQHGFKTASMIYVVLIVGVVIFTVALTLFGVSIIASQSYSTINPASGQAANTLIANSKAFSNIYTGIKSLLFGVIIADVIFFILEIGAYYLCYDATSRTLNALGAGTPAPN